MNAANPLYEQLLGEDWFEVAAAVRSAHAVGVEHRGQFRVRHGRGLASWLARWSGLPPAADSVDARLTIRSTGSTQHWVRHFDGFLFQTWQRAGDDGRLHERLGRWELSFALEVDDDAGLVYVQRGARLNIGCCMLPIPSALSPLVVAREAALAADRVSVIVRISIPVFGLLTIYEGIVDAGVAVP